MHFTRVGEFCEPDNYALTGKSSAINPNPTGWLSNGTYIGKNLHKEPTVNNDDLEVETDSTKCYFPWA